MKKVTGHGRLVDENTKISGFVFLCVFFVLFLFLKKFRFLKNSLYNNKNPIYVKIKAILSEIIFFINLNW